MKMHYIKILLWKLVCRATDKSACEVKKRHEAVLFLRQTMRRNKIVGGVTDFKMWTSPRTPWYENMGQSAKYSEGRTEV